MTPSTGVFYKYDAMDCVPFVHGDDDTPSDDTSGDDAPVWAGKPPVGKDSKVRAPLPFEDKISTAVASQCSALTNVGVQPGYSANYFAGTFALGIAVGGLFSWSFLRSKAAYERLPILGQPAYQNII